MNMRKNWLDNLRWFTVLLVLLYHVFYFYNNKGVFGGVGGFGDGPQYQDAILYILYPWFMPLLFLLAGISARYALEHHSEKEWFGARTLKLLVPSTIGILVFHWILGWVNTNLTGTDVLAAVPQPYRFFLRSISGVGPLWFIQDLWLFSLLLLIIRKLDIKGKLSKFFCKCFEGKFGILVLILLAVLFWLGEQTLVMNPEPGLDALYNLYKPVFYLLAFLAGYFVFAHESVQQTLGKVWIPMMACAATAGICLTVSTFGQDYTSPQYMSSVLNCLYGALMCLAMIGLFQARFNGTNAFAGYMTRSSFGLYILHYLVIAAVGLALKQHSSLPPYAMYLLLTLAVFTLSPLLYELIRRIPVIRWCVLGIRKR